MEQKKREFVRIGRLVDKNREPPKSILPNFLSPRFRASQTFVHTGTRYVPGEVWAFLGYLSGGTYNRGYGWG